MLALGLTHSNVKTHTGLQQKQIRGIVVQLIDVWGWGGGGVGGGVGVINANIDQYFYKKEQPVNIKQVLILNLRIRN